MKSWMNGWMVVTGLMLTLVAGGAARADVVLKFNFGANISATPGFTDYVQADAAYTAAAGRGWTFKDSNLLFRDRGTATPATNTSTLAVDRRAGLPDLRAVTDLYTFRVNLPNGKYQVTAVIGDDVSKTHTVLALGDTFGAGTKSSQLEESATSTVLFTPAGGQYLDQAAHMTLTKEFTVTQGYLLVGMRFQDNQTRFGSLDSLVVQSAPEPATLSIVGGAIGGLMLVGRGARQAGK